MKLDSYLLKASIVGALGGLLFGFDTAVIAGTTHSLSQIFNLTPWTLGITVSIALWGTVIGALGAGVLGQRLGGRNALRIMAVLYIVSALGCALAWNWPALVVFRFVGGLGIGGSSVLAPVYIAELAPARLRGRLVGMFQINVVLGILLAYFSNYCVARLGLGALEWRWQLGIAAAPALLFFIMLFGIPQSPRWLATQHRVEESGDVLKLLGSPDYRAELNEIVNSIHLEQSQGSEPLFSRKFRYPIFLAIATGVFNQLAGINAILYYLPAIFMAAGFSKISGDLQSVAIGAMNLCATLLAMALIDKLGRKTLLLIGSAGTALCLAGVAQIFFTQQHQSRLVWILVGYIFFFAPLGAVIWVYIGEIFPNTVRSKGQSLGSSSHWIMNALISALFPVVAKTSGAYPFVFFAAMMVLQFFVVLLFYPETKGFTLEEMQHRLSID
jgi:SP family arabinose:H+ symporter-like MFS transporter